MSELLNEYEFKNISPIDIGFWANMNEDWRILLVGRDVINAPCVVLWRERKK